jgi:hypothetical protein
MAQGASVCAGNVPSAIFTLPQPNRKNLEITQEGKNIFLV